MEGTLKVTPEQLNSTASDFQSKGSTISNLTNEMMTLVTGMNGIWEGDAATAYITKFQSLQDDIGKLISMVNEHVNDLQEMASAYQSAESANAELANSLSGDVIV